jgi:hypothetical protein
MLPTRLHASRRRAAWLAVVVVLLLAQTLGLLHRVAHAPTAGLGPHKFAAAQSRPVEPAAAVHASAEHAPSGGHGLAALFGGHDGGGCASYDQAAHSDLLVSAAPALGAIAVSVAVAAPQCAGQPAAQAAGYLARGPPALV